MVVVCGGGGGIPFSGFGEFFLISMGGDVSTILFTHCPQRL